MNKIKFLLVAVVAGLCFTVSAPKTHAQVGVTVDVGAAPDCPYGYYDYAPYACAPYGYYGPEWFTSGVFIGVGPWFHGANDFHGRVNNKYDTAHGYKGPLPSKGDKPDPSMHPDQNPKFKGNESRDGRGHTVPDKH